MCLGDICESFGVIGSHDCDFPIYFCVFSEVRDPNGAPKGGLEALLGPSWDPLGDFGHTFAASRLQVCRLSAKSDAVPRSMLVNVKGLRQGLAQRRGGGFASELCKGFLSTV